MLTFHRRTPAEGSSLHPWEAPHAAPEDRAVGLELELIELVHRRDEVSEHNDLERERLDGEIAQVVQDLDAVSSQIGALGVAAA